MRLHQGLRREVRRYRSGYRSAAAEAFACGQLLELVAQRTGKIDNATIISALHKGSWPTWKAISPGTPTARHRLGHRRPVGRRQTAAGYPPAEAFAKPIAKPAWAG